jgi:hypothetical protein
VSWPTAPGDLASCPAAAASWHHGAGRQRHGYKRGRPPAAGSSLTPPNFDFQPFGALLSEVCF